MTLLAIFEALVGANAIWETTVWLRALEGVSVTYNKPSRF